MIARFPKRLGGGHIALMLVAFFAVVIGVNLLMAVLASRTFGGAVVESSYVASQQYNDWLKEGQQQARLGWAVSSSAQADGRVRLYLSKAGRPLGSASVTAVVEHPLGRTDPLHLGFREDGAGGYLSEQPLAHGRWHVLLDIVHGRSRMRVDQEISY